MVILMCRHSLIETFSHETRVKKVPRSRQFYMLYFSYRIHIYQPMMLMPTDSLTGAWFVLSGHELLWSSMFAHQREQRVLQNVLYYRYLIIWVCFLASPVNLCFFACPTNPMFDMCVGVMMLPWLDFHAHLLGTQRHRWVGRSTLGGSE